MRGASLFSDGVFFPGTKIRSITFSHCVLWPCAKKGIFLLPDLLRTGGLHLFPILLFCWVPKWVCPNLRHPFFHKVHFCWIPKWTRPSHILQKIAHCLLVQGVTRDHENVFKKHYTHSIAHFLLVQDVSRGIENALRSTTHLRKCFEKDPENALRKPSRRLKTL